MMNSQTSNICVVFRATTNAYLYLAISETLPHFDTIKLLIRVTGHASEDIKLTSGSVIEISRLPGYTLQARGEITGQN